MFTQVIFDDFKYKIVENKLATLREYLRSSKYINS
jgi:hypothetical protein